MFVRFDCGCIGFAPLPGARDSAVVINPCDAERDTPRNSLSWGVRDMSGKPYTYLDEREAAVYHARLAKRLNLADRFDDVRSALGIEAFGA